MPSDLCAQFIKEVTDDEIFNVSKRMPKNKFPGPNGYTSEFFIVEWEIVGILVISAIMEFFQTSKLLKQLNSTVIALIPKTQHLTMITEFGPISCCNIVQGRKIIDNVLLSHEVVKDYRRPSSKPICAIKIDLEKAFDSIHWDFALNTLTAMGFPSLFIHWLIECITTTTFCVKINGKLEGFFRGIRGIRQGDFYHHIFLSRVWKFSLNYWILLFVREK